MVASCRSEGGARESARPWRSAFWLSAFVCVALIASLVPDLKTSADLVKLRNALLYSSEPASYDWTPTTTPADFTIETHDPNRLYADTIKQHDLVVSGDDWATTLKIARHLLNPDLTRGSAIQSDLDDTYTRITNSGEGYCGDYADTFTGLANAAGVFSRPWAFSFDGFGGHGHIFNEIWDRQQQRWIMLDVFNNVYFTDPSGKPLSAMQLRGALFDAEGDEPRVVPVNPLAHPGYIHEHKLFEFYRRGLPEWYMWWGNNVFEYDHSKLVRALGNVHRSVEQLGAIVAGVAPAIKVIETPRNLAQRNALQSLRLRLLFIVVSGVLALVFLLIWMGKRSRST